MTTACTSGALIIMAYYVGIDIGTSGTRAIVIDEAGKLQGTGTAAHTCQAPHPLWSEQSPLEWWEAVKTAVPAAVAAANVKPDDIKGVGLSGQMHGLVLLDKKHDVLRPAILWNDQRTADECVQITERAGGRAKLLDLVSNPALTGFTAPKILWVRNNEPELYAHAVKALLPKDYIRFKLSGEFATEVSDASGTLLLDVNKRQWSMELLSKLEIDAALLPECFESTVPSAQVSAASSEALGGALKAGTPIVGGAGDCAAGAVGAGIVKSGVANISIGTSGVVFVHADEPKTDPLGRAHTFCHAVPGKWHNMGVTLSAGGSLQWFKNTLGHPEAAVAKLTEGDAYDILVLEVQTVQAGCEGLCFLPYLTGERTPHADPFATGCFIGITPRTTKGHLARAVIEGVCYSLRECVEIFRGMNIPVSEARVTGGGSKNPFWSQTLADMFGQNTCSLVAAEGAAYGVALLAAVGTGAYASVEEACAAAVNTCREMTPNPSHAAAYERYYPVWTDLYAALRSSFARLAKA
ncbi:MAG TPA: xylulokinase [Planctomycetota bacterium]|nr:xylulokinase [Planctomycetota bacterium]